MDIANIIGVIGAGIVLLAFLLIQSGKLLNTSVLYDFLNFVGSLFLLIYAVINNSVPFIFVNLVWSLFSLKDCILYLINSRDRSNT